MSRRSHAAWRQRRRANQRVQPGGGSPEAAAGAADRPEVVDRPDVVEPLDGRSGDPREHGIARAPDAWVPPEGRSRRTNGGRGHERRSEPAGAAPRVDAAPRGDAAPRRDPEAAARRDADVAGSGGAASSSDRRPPGACTAPQLRRFIKSRAYVPLHELRRRFGINGAEDEVTAIDLDGHRIFVGLPRREGELLGDLLRAGDVGYELSLDPRSPVVVGVYPMRPVPRT